MPSSRLKMLLAAALFAGAFATAPSSASAQSTSPSSTATTGGVSPDDPQFRPTGKAKLINGMAIPPADAPPEVKRAIDAANAISRKPYKYGGGHASFPEDSGYDCSGTISYALHGAGLLGGGPLDSTGFMSWGVRGKGKWITTYANPGHAFIVIAGLRFDTGYRDRTARGLAPGRGPRWGKMRSTRGFKARHPAGF